jgi:hypothetical protein
MGSEARDPSPAKTKDLLRKSKFLLPLPLKGRGTFFLVLASVNKGGLM